MSGPTPRDPRNARRDPRREPRHELRRQEPLFPNALTVARREYTEKVGSRLFHLSTVLLATLAVILAFSPILVRLADSGQHDPDRHRRQ